MERLSAIESVEVQQSGDILISNHRDAASRANEDMRRLLPLMPNLKHFTSALSFPAKRFQCMSRVHPEYLKTSLQAKTVAKWLLKGVQGSNMGDLQLSSLIYIHERLFELREMDASDTNYVCWLFRNTRSLPALTYDGLRELVFDTPKNHVVFVGTPSNGPHSWYGLDFIGIQEGVSAFEDVLADSWNGK